MPPLSAEHRAEIDELRSQAALRPTRRAVAPALEEILYEPLPVLDHGFVRVIDYMGDDAAVVQAARVSYGRGTKQVSSDRGLINYLMRHRHTSPFEMCELKLHVKLPIFVARQWIRHRTANVNEYSARYSILDREFYVPAPEHLAAQAASNRQGRGEVLEGAEAEAVLRALREDAAWAFARYRELLNEDDDDDGDGDAGGMDRPDDGAARPAPPRPADPGRRGLARELARITLPLSTYTQWYWKVDLHNLLHFLSLRADPHAQYEIRAYAEVLLGVARRWVPLTWDAFANHVLGGAHLSAAALAAVRRMLTGEAVSQETSGLPPREWRELQEVLRPPPPPG